jgi:hypothetical protein
MVIVGWAFSPTPTVLPLTVAACSGNDVDEAVGAAGPVTGAPGICWTLVTELFWYGNVTTTPDEASGFDWNAASATLAPMRTAVKAMTPPRAHMAGRRRMIGVGAAPDSGDEAAASTERSPPVRRARPNLT